MSPREHVSNWSTPRRPPSLVGPKADTPLDPQHGQWRSARTRCTAGPLNDAKPLFEARQCLADDLKEYLLRLRNHRKAVPDLGGFLRPRPTAPSDEEQYFASVPASHWRARVHARSRPGPRPTGRRDRHIGQPWLWHSTRPMKAFVST
jgi:hypothetical protein